MSNARNNILAGAFVLAGLGLGVWVSFVLSDRSGFAGAREFTVQFPLASGAMGLKRGSPLLLAGQPIGRVLGVTFDSAKKDGVPTAVNVRVEADPSIVVYENATVTLEKPLLGSLSSINITAVGDAGAPGARGRGPQIEDGEMVPGRVAPPAFLADAGFGPEQSDQVRGAIKGVDEGVRKLTEMIDRSGPKVDAGVADAQALLADLRRNIAAWSAKIDTTTANIEAASAKLDPLMKKIDGGLDDARTVVASIKSLIDDNRGRIDSTIRSVESAASKIDQETLAGVNAALREGRDALGVFSDSVSRVSAVVGEETPSLRRTLANLRLMSDQLKLTAVEVRSQPWRLLHQPTSKEMESQVLYDATRSYAEAASDLRAASESLEAAAAIHASGQSGAPDLTALSGTMTDALARYRQAERYLFDKLVEKERK